jgi:hypothetical protein
MTTPKKLLVLGTLLALAPLAASAHVLKVDGQIGALLHTDPDDAPLVGTPTAFYLQFKDSAAPLMLQDDYALDVTVSNSTGATAEILPVGWSYVGTGELDFSYTFPEKGSYTLNVLGVPKKQGFSTFALHYDILAGADNPDHDSDIAAFNAFGASTSPAAVATTAATSTPGFFLEHIEHLVLFGGAILLALILILRDLYLRRKKPLNPMV